MRDFVEVESGPAPGDAAAHLREQAERCRRLCRSVTDPRTVETLNTMASEYEAQARTLNRTN